MANSDKPEAGAPQNVKVSVSSDDIGLAMLVLGFLILTWGDPDLLDVLAHWCKQQMGTR